MLVKLRTTMASPELTAPAGSIVDVAEDFASELIAGGYASAVEPIAEQVATAANDDERATVPKGRKK